MSCSLFSGSSPPGPVLSLKAIGLPQCLEMAASNASTRGRCEGLRHEEDSTMVQRGPALSMMRPRRCAKIEEMSKEPGEVANFAYVPSSPWPISRDATELIMALGPVALSPDASLLRARLLSQSSKGDWPGASRMPTFTTPSASTKTNVSLGISPRGIVCEPLLSSFPTSKSSRHFASPSRLALWSSSVSVFSTGRAALSGLLITHDKKLIIQRHF
mmetsp:Transcript_115810/g.201050  ORF Transcript_115810/g.201050 Transcript_115810/m.201050 type:complete len:216 (-) Transcript_115810:21-668(-)